MIAALAMRKLQALHLLSTPGVMTTTDVVITIVQDLDRALVQAPNMRLKLQAAATDWDAAFAELDPVGDDEIDRPAPGGLHVVPDLEPDPDGETDFDGETDYDGETDFVDAEPVDTVDLGDRVDLADDAGPGLTAVPDVTDDAEILDLSDGDLQGFGPPDPEGLFDPDDLQALAGFEVSLAGLERSIDGLSDEFDDDLSYLHRDDGDPEAPVTMAAGVPTDAAQADPAVERFRSLHAKLHEAVYAVIEASEGEIRYLA